MFVLCFRYLHLVENVRPDLELIDVEVMSYGWSVRLQKFHTRLKYPADFWHLTNRVHSHGRSSFNFKALLDANFKRYGCLIFMCKVALPSVEDGDLLTCIILIRIVSAININVVLDCKVKGVSM